MSVPLNQSFRIEETLREWPAVAAALEGFESWARTSVGWCPYDLHTSLGRPKMINVGRSYDAAIALVSVDFGGLDVLELGARASFLGPYLTQRAAHVTVTDLFGTSHPELGDLDYWTDLWTRAAFRPERLTCEIADMRATHYPDESFDAVVSLSAIEHVTRPEDGDTVSAVEMARVCRLGGYVVIGTDLSDRFRRRGGYYYDEKALFERLVEPTGCPLLGDTDLSWENADKYRHRSDEFDTSCCIFILRKPVR